MSNTHTLAAYLLKIAQDSCPVNNFSAFSFLFYRYFSQAFPRTGAGRPKTDGLSCGWPLPAFPVSAFFKGSAGSFPAVRRFASPDIHMIRQAFIVAVVDTFHRLAVNADGTAGMFGFIGRAVALFLPETLTAGFLAA